jgi:hypothetical protein
MGISLGDVVTIFSGPVGILQKRLGSSGSGSFSGLPPILLGRLTGMDVQGEQILGTYLYGGGEDKVAEDPAWTEYMMAHPVLQGTLLIRLRDIVTPIANRKTPGTYNIYERFHFEFPENSGFSGYALLHGSNRNAGDFLMAGSAELCEANDRADGAYDIAMDLRYTFNDIVDPNGDYMMDVIRSTVAILVTVGLASDYRLSINWVSKCKAKVRPGQPIVFSGYPFDRTK